MFAFAQSQRATTAGIVAPTAAFFLRVRPLAVALWGHAGCGATATGTGLLCGADSASTFFSRGSQPHRSLAAVTTGECDCVGKAALEPRLQCHLTGKGRRLAAAYVDIGAEVHEVRAPALAAGVGGPSPQELKDCGRELLFRWRKICGKVCKE